MSDTYRLAVIERGLEADLYRDVALSNLGSHVTAAVEVARADVIENGGDIDALIDDTIASIKDEVAACLDRTAGHLRADQFGQKKASPR